MKPASRDTARLHVEQAGPPDGPALVLLHALGGSGEDWLLQRGTLVGAGYRVLMVDARGHGRSEKPHGRYSIEGMAADVARALDELGVDRADVYGLSLGGAIALALALDYPERVRRLVLVNTAARYLPRDASRLLYYGARLILLSFIGPRWQARLVARRVFPRPEHADLRRMLSERLAANDRRAYRRAAGALMRFDVRHRLSQIRVPTLVVAGAEDTTIPLHQKQELAEAIPGARLEVVPGSGHATIVDCAQTFNRLLLDSLAEG